tara:strand:+ start:291 stop:470 length:180 start_codon:yes stop_codon:yes gene_type:complete
MSEIYCETYTYCDECGTKGPVFEDTSVTQYKYWMRKQGWSFGKWIKCYGCSGKVVTDVD